MPRASTFETITPAVGPAFIRSRMKLLPQHQTKTQQRGQQIQQLE
jgi:hypothetical protein